MRIVISYTSADRDQLPRLLDGLHRLHHSVWHDREMSGGQFWWETILSRIRDADAVLPVLSPAFLKSEACAREVEYAAALGKPLLPVLIEWVLPDLLPPRLAPLQFVDFRQAGEAAAFDLVAALTALPAVAMLPDPLPEPPAVPLSYLGHLIEQVQAASLTLDEQLLVVAKLRLELDRPEHRAAALEVLRLLQQRNDLYVVTARDLAQLVTAEALRADQTNRPPEKSQDLQAAMPISAPPGFYPDPTGRRRERYWTGTEWTAKVRKRGIEDLDRPSGLAELPPPGPISSD